MLRRILERLLFGLTLVGYAASPALAADMEAGAELASQCSACHGSAGISTADNFPNLAAQKAGYIEAQLRAFRAGERANDLMNAVAASLSDSDIENLAAHFSNLPGAEPGATAANLTSLDGSVPAFPADFERSFTRYQRIDFETRKQVRFYRANEAALAAAKAGDSLPDGAYLLVEIFKAQVDGDGNLLRDADGQLVVGDRAAYTAMEKRSGSSDEVPAILRNGDWRYAVFNLEGEHRAGLNEGPCLACHKPLDASDYVFTLGTLQDFAKTN